MDINEKNHDFNQWAFLKKNSIDDIIYCPFCGVGKAYLSNDNEIIEVKSKLLDEKTLKILDHAAKLELFNGDFYNTAAKMAKSEEVSKLFEALGRIEIFHSKIHLKLGGFTKIPSLTKIDYSKYDSDDSLLELAKQRETHAIEYYEKYKREVNSKNLSIVFEALIEVENDHITLIKE